MQMHVNDLVPIVLAHVEEKAVAQDAGVVDDAIEPTVGVHRQLHHARSGVPVGHAVAVGNGLAASGGDLIDHLLGPFAVAALAVQ